jgi:hypothetical protein
VILRRVAGTGALLLVGLALTMATGGCSLAPPTVASRPLSGPFYRSPRGPASDLLGFARKDDFSDYAASALTTAQAAAVKVGTPVILYSLDSLRAAGDGFLLERSSRVGTEMLVPLVLGDRTIAIVLVERDRRGWADEHSTATESSDLDHARRQIVQDIRRRLGGEPDAIGEAYVLASDWVLARRGAREVAALVNSGGYSQFRGPKGPDLPASGVVLDGAQFKALLSQMPR